MVAGAGEGSSSEMDSRRAATAIEGDASGDGGDAAASLSVSLCSLAADSGAAWWDARGARCGSFPPLSVLVRTIGPSLSRSSVPLVQSLGQHSATCGASLNTGRSKHRSRSDRFRVCCTGPDWVQRPDAVMRRCNACGLMPCINSYCPAGLPHASLTSLHAARSVSPSASAASSAAPSATADPVPLRPEATYAATRRSWPVTSRRDVRSGRA